MSRGNHAVAKRVVAYNRLANFEKEYRSMTECAKALDVPVDRVSRRCRDGNWIFGEMIVKVRLA